MSRLKLLVSVRGLEGLVGSNRVTRRGATLKRLLFALSILMSHTGCGAVANQAVPPPWLVGAECSQDSTEVEEQTFVINVLMSALAGSMVVIGGQCDGYCSGYEGMAELGIGLAGLTAGFIYTANERALGRYNAINCVEYLKELQAKLANARLERTKRIKRPPPSKTDEEGSSSQKASSSADSRDTIQKPSVPEREPTPIVPLRDGSPK